MELIGKLLFRDFRVSVNAELANIIDRSTFGPRSIKTESDCFMPIDALGIATPIADDVELGGIK